MGNTTLSHLPVVRLCPPVGVGESLIRRAVMTRHATLTYLLVVRLCPSVSIAVVQSLIRRSVPGQCDPVSSPSGEALSVCWRWRVDDMKSGDDASRDPHLYPNGKALSLCQHCRCRVVDTTFCARAIRPSHLPVVRPCPSVGVGESMI